MVLFFSLLLLLPTAQATTETATVWTGHSYDMTNRSFSMDNSSNTRLTRTGNTTLLSFDNFSPSRWQGPLSLMWKTDPDLHADTELQTLSAEYSAYPQDVILEGYGHRNCLPPSPKDPLNQKCLSTIFLDDSLIIIREHFRGEQLLIHNETFNYDMTPRNKRVDILTKTNPSPSPGLYCPPRGHSNPDV